MLAIARDDLDEVQALDAAAPRGIISCAQPAYSALLRASRAVAADYACVCGVSVGQLDLLDAIAPSIRHASTSTIKHLQRELGLRVDEIWGSEQPEPDPEYPFVVMTVAADRAAGELASAREPLARVSRARMGVDPEVVLAVHATGMQRAIARHQGRIDAATIDRASVRALHRCLVRTWDEAIEGLC
jgi:hypothetical protein